MRKPSDHPLPDTAPTLLIFTRGAERERARRRLLPPRLRQLELALHHRGLEVAIEAGRAAGCHIVVSSPAPLELPEGVDRLPQKGLGLGDRLCTAIAETFEAFCSSGGPILVVGTDAPDLGGGHLRRALATLRLDSEAVVLGPSTDGGFYLLAASRPLAEELAATSWCRADTLSSLQKQLQQSGRPCLLLESLTDLDRPSDLAAWLATAPRRFRVSTPELDEFEWWPLLRFLRRAIAALRRLETPPRIGSPRLSTVAVGSGRSPPPVR
ncbi:MAG: DUF2064 domain-containing protein [Acidobacteriota bacterium]|nr:DUF2064 domain-containing protein [Acidobacteriota bacterium]